MKILLVNPPSPFLLDDRVFLTLGVLQVATVLEEAGHDVWVEDLGGCTDYVKIMEKRASEEWDCYGMTATTPQFPMALEILRAIRKCDPGKRVLIGGPHATVMPESCGMFDCVVRGDGESVILDALSPHAPPVLDAATSVQKGELRYSWPARHLIDMDSYRYSLNGLKGTSMMFSTGCPYNCGFCAGRSLAFYRRVRVRPADDVVREMQFLSDQYGIRAVMAFDDEINLLNEPLIEFCRKVKPLGMKFRGFVKANLFNDVQAEAMANAGFVEACTGVEAGSDRILAIMDKRTTREINKRFVDLCHKHGMRAKSFCSLGHPGESYESAMELKSWLLWAQPDDFDVTVITVYPSSPYWDKREFVRMDGEKRICQYVKHSRNPDEDGATLFFEEVNYAAEWAYYKGIPGQYISHVWTPDLSKEELVHLRDEVEGAVRKELAIPYPVRHSGDNFEHSMGQGATFQDSRVVLKESS